MWSVVEFPMEKKGSSTAMEIIPTNWLHVIEGQMFCWFPTKYKKGHFKTAVKEREDPDISSWKEYLVKVLYKKGIQRSFLKHIIVWVF